MAPNEDNRSRAKAWAAGIDAAKAGVQPHHLPA
jgi:hypothetical protein